MAEKRVSGYPFDRMRNKKELALRTYEYDFPFNFPNINVWRKYYPGGEFHGMELYVQNAVSPSAKLTRITPNEWTSMQTCFTVPPEATAAEFRLNVNDMAPGEILRIADPFAGRVPKEWNEHDDIPAGVVNLISNSGFSGEKIPPTGWQMDPDDIGTITFEKEKTAKSGSSLKLEGVKISLFTEFKVKPGQRFVMALRVKSTKRTSRTVVLFPSWKDKRGFYLNDESGDAVIITETDPIVRVAVIGSACTPPGFVTLEAEPLEEFYGRGDFVRSIAPVRFKQGNLWGMHLRFDQWATEAGSAPGYEKIPEGLIKRYPGIERNHVKAHYREYPLTGMSCAIFEIPASRKVIIQGGSERPGWLSDSYPTDDHYSFRTIRTTVRAKGR